MTKEINKERHDDFALYSPMEQMTKRPMPKRRNLPSGDIQITSISQKTKLHLLRVRYHPYWHSCRHELAKHFIKKLKELRNPADGIFYSSVIKFN